MDPSVLACPHRISQPCEDSRSPSSRSVLVLWVICRTAVGCGPDMLGPSLILKPRISVHARATSLDARKRAPPAAETNRWDCLSRATCKGVASANERRVLPSAKRGVRCEQHRLEMDVFVDVNVGVHEHM